MKSRKHYKPGEIIDFDVIVVNLTDQALCISYEGDEQWIPRSQIWDDVSNVQIGDTISIGMTDSFAEEKGWLR